MLNFNNILKCVIYRVGKVRMKNGPPSKAVMTPAGTSPGASAMRDSVSQIAEMRLPAERTQEPEVCGRLRRSGAARGGTIGPTKPMGPVKAVTPPVSTKPVTYSIISIRLVSTPRAAAHHRRPRSSSSLLPSRNKQQTVVGRMRRATLASPLERTQPRPSAIG